MFSHRLFLSFTVSVWKCCDAQWLMGFPHILSTRAFSGLDRIDPVLEWLHVGCKTLMVSFGWEWGTYSMGYVPVSASFKSIALAWASSAWDMFAMRNFASNKVFCEARAIWKVQVLLVWEHSFQLVCNHILSLRFLSLTAFSKGRKNVSGMSLATQSLLYFSRNLLSLCSMQVGMGDD